LSWKSGLTIIIVCLLSFTAASKDQYQQVGPVHLDNDGRKWAERTLKKMSLEEKVGQMFMVWSRVQFFNLAGPDYAQFRQDIGKYHVGGFAVSVPAEGVFIYRSAPYEVAALLNQLQRDSKIPLIFAADFERGLAMRFNGATDFPHAMAFGATGKVEDVEAMARITAQESRALGIQWNFFPVADVNSNPANPIINTRSFGEDPQEVAQLAAAYIRTARANGLMTTAKHFPGHGDTATDTHLGLATVTGDHAHLEAVELPPFREAIAAGTDAVMTGHLLVPALQGKSQRVSTTDPRIVTEFLRQQLGFTGIAVTDAMDMGALTRLYADNIGRAAVDAIKAGNDVVLIPADLDASYNAVLQAVRTGDITEDRINASVRKLLQAKASVGLNKARLVDLTQVANLIGQSQNVALGQQIADRAVTLVRDNGHVLPLKASKGTKKPQLPYQPKDAVQDRVVAVIFSDDVRAEAGHVFERQLRLRVPDAHFFSVDARTAMPMTDAILTAVGRAETVVAAVYATPVAGEVSNGPNGVQNNSISLSEGSASLLSGIVQRANSKTLVIAMGNPYLAVDFPEVENYMCSFSSEAVSEVSAVKALFGEIAISGRLPVTIPHIAQRGSGLDRRLSPP